MEGVTRSTLQYPVVLPVNGFSDLKIFKRGKKKENINVSHSFFFRHLNE